MFTAVLDKDLADRRKTTELDVAPLLGDSYGSNIQACRPHSARALRYFLFVALCCVHAGI